MNAPVSVIIPTLNEAKYLPKLLASLKDQTTPPAEIIVSDARSTDTTREIAASYKCKVVDDFPREGPGMGRNRGATAAKQEILLFLDSDVIVAPTFLERSLGEFTRRNLGIAACNIRPLPGDQLSYPGIAFANFYFNAISHYRIHAPGYCLLVKQTIHQQISGFDKTLLLAEDHDYAERASKYGKFGYLTSDKVAISTRRFKEEGAIKTAWKYTLAEIHLLFMGPVRKPLFKFEFGKHFKE